MRILAPIVAAAACALMSSVAPAQSYPVKPIRIVTPYAPGGTADILSRVVAQKLSEAWGQQVLVDHRPGASGMIGAEIAAKAAPDGYTILMAYIAEIAITKSLFKTMAYDPVRDLAPVTLGLRFYSEVAGQLSACGSRKGQATQGLMWAPCGLGPVPKLA